MREIVLICTISDHISGPKDPVIKEICDAFQVSSYDLLYRLDPHTMCTRIYVTKKKGIISEWLSKIHIMDKRWETRAEIATNHLVTAN